MQRKKIQKLHEVKVATEQSMQTQSSSSPAGFSQLVGQRSNYVSKVVYARDGRISWGLRVSNEDVVKGSDARGDCDKDDERSDLWPNREVSKKKPG